MSFEIKIGNPHWLGQPSEQVNDLCLHACVFLRVGKEVLDSGSTNVWCVSAGALRMMRSLFADHQSGEEEQLLPCCGHFMVAKNDGTQVDIIGCPNGIDFAVLHHGPDIELITAEGISHTVSYGEYKAAVLAFAREVESYYCLSKQKDPSDDFDRAGYQAFWTEWHTLTERIRLLSEADGYRTDG